MPDEKPIPTSTPAVRSEAKVCKHCGCHDWDENPACPRCGMSFDAPGPITVEEANKTAVDPAAPPAKAAKAAPVTEPAPSA